ncbi:EF-hand domain-containing protein [Flavivirga amylovorans]|uniref:EF-hand domain-containing protein n=1 Tax=Flavivirga amylovorans TaxID=870486 RepID=A0ABT8X4T9_9FLAO|nr:EF-hand domain-containing protein [Flavivirga amylovorans]MDO5988996.1 EF-hand domain-containing protein [Flavivirga amylovorans]
MKKIILVLCMGFIISWNTKNENIQTLPDTVSVLKNQRTLPENIESLGVINSKSKIVSNYLLMNKIDALSPNLDEVSLYKFKDNEGKFAFSIPLKTSNENLSEVLLVYFNESDLTNYKSVVHSVESFKDNQKNKNTVVNVRTIDGAWFSKIEFINGKRKIRAQVDNIQPPEECVIPSFMDIDTNGNGLISEDEYKSATFMSSILKKNSSFGSLDQNGDGNISLSEFSIDCFELCFLCTVEIYGCEGDHLCMIAISDGCAVSCNA